MNLARTILVAAACFAFAVISPAAQDSKPNVPRVKDAADAPQEKGSRDYSGMYSFLKDGEFVQITVEDESRVTGFVSRYGEEKNENGGFLDHYFRSAKLDGNSLRFTTQMVQAKWFDFKGSVERGEGKNPGDEGYYVLKGTLTDNTSDAQKKTTTHSQEVTFKRFPVDALPARNY